MKLLTRIVAYLLFVGGLLIFMIMPGNRYGWMREMDPSITSLPIDGASGNRMIFTLLLLIVIVATQSAIAVKATNKTEKVLSIVLVLIAILVWSLRIVG